MKLVYVLDLKISLLALIFESILTKSYKDLHKGIPRLIKRNEIIYIKSKINNSISV